MLKEAIEQGKRKLTSNSDFMQVHALYKKLKVSLDEVKVMENERSEILTNRRQMASLQEEALSKELKHIQEKNLILR